jgi:solute carrier family 25 (mitochondrial dicarboxylate transporter), member 10
MTYSMTRFGIYETVKQQIDKPGVPMPFYQKVLLGGFAGCVGGFVGTPADLINVRLVFIRNFVVAVV